MCYVHAAYILIIMKTASEAGTAGVNLGSDLIVYYNGGCSFKGEEGEGVGHSYNHHHHRYNHHHRHHVNFERMEKDGDIIMTNINNLVGVLTN